MTLITTSPDICMVGMVSWMVPRGRSTRVVGAAASDDVRARWTILRSLRDAHF